MRKTRLAGLLAASSLLAGPAQAATEISVHYNMPHVFQHVMDELVTAFEAAHPDIRVELLNPSPSYEDGQQLVLRQAITGDLPDVAFQGLNRLRVFAERGLAQDLTPFLEGEGDPVALGYTERLQSLGQFGGIQAGLAFATSTPIVYYNADLVRAAGGDPDAFPDNWDDLLALGAAIDDLGPDTNSMHFRWMGDDWMFSALLFSHGGRMLNDDESDVAFNEPEGLAAITVLDRMVKEGKMPVFTSDAGQQAFLSGTTGMMMGTTAYLTSTIATVGDNFELRTTRLPIADAERGGLPTGGNAAMMLATDPEKQAAAWTFIKFATGPQGAAIVVPGTGYVPNNQLVIDDPQYLGDFYAENPLYQAAFRQIPIMQPWYAFPGEHGVRVTAIMVDHLARVVEQTATPEEALEDMAEEVRRLLPSS